MITKKELDDAIEYLLDLPPEELIRYAEEAESKLWVEEIERASDDVASLPPGERAKLAARPDSNEVA